MMFGVVVGNFVILVIDEFGVFVFDGIVYFGDLV